MHRLLPFSIVSLMCLALIVGGTISLAQDNQPPERLDRMDRLGEVMGSVDGGVDKMLGDTPLLNKPADVNQQESSTAIVLGQPGLSYRYLESYGSAKDAYLEDTAHLNYPYGVTVDGANVWVAELNGKRALKYANNGTYLTQIGKAGYRYGEDGTSLEGLTDVAVDSASNTWVVDAYSHHVAKFDSAGDFVSELGVMWNSGTTNDKFRSPRSVAFNSAGYIFVSDRNNHRVQVFNSAGTYQTTIGVTAVSGSDNDHFNRPEHIHIDNNNWLYVADPGNHRVQVFSVANIASITYLATLGVSGQWGSDNAHLNWPLGVFVDNLKIYVADCGNDRIQIFNRANGAYQNTIGTGWGTGNYQFKCPSDVAADSAGNIFVVDNENHRMQQYNASRNYVRTYGVTGIPYLTDNYHYNGLTGVAVALDNSIYFVEDWGNRLVKLDPAGVQLWAIGEAGIWGDDNAHFDFPEDVDVDSAGRVYVADSSNNRVQIYNSDSSYYATLGTGYGTGNYQFDWAIGVAVDGLGNVYVADFGNHRIQIYNSSLTYVATIGQTGVAGSDNAHFSEPRDVDVDSSGNIYVLDHGNQRVQVFNSSRDYQRTVGETGVSGSDFGHFSNPIALTVDAAGNLFVSDSWGGRIRVFDNTGAFLTTLGNGWGDLPGNFHQVEGLAMDSAGNLYTANWLKHIVDKFSPGVPGWQQKNINGFGDYLNRSVYALEPFDGDLYAGTYSYGTGAQIWKMNNAGEWTAVVDDGLGDAYDTLVLDLTEFKDHLYAGIENWNWNTNTSAGGSIWRSDNGLDWTRVVTQGLGDAANGSIGSFVVFSDTLYAGVWSDPSVHSAEIWRSTNGDAGTWTRAMVNGFNGDANNVGIVTMVVYNTQIYAGTWNENTGGEVWRSADGTSWQQVNNDGFNSTNNSSVLSLTPFNGYLYAGTRNWTTGAEIWRCDDCSTPGDWEIVMANGFNGFSGNSNGRVEGLLVFDSSLYATVYNYDTGMQVWRSGDGLSWEQVGFEGFGDVNNYSCWVNSSMAIYNHTMFISTHNNQGGEVWMYLHHKNYLPLVIR